MLNKYQMELGLDATAAIRQNAQHQRHLKRAQWWFKQMRRAVDCAMDWQPAPKARSEQVHMTLTPRW